MQVYTHDSAVMTATSFATHSPVSNSQVRVQVCDHGDPGRAAAENFIHRRFAQIYDAQVNQHMPRLLVFHNDHNEMIAALGLRAAAQQPLFLEAYLDMPVQQCIHDTTQGMPARERIVEIGNLALSTAGQARLVILAMTAFLCGAGIDWVVFTAVSSLRNTFQRMGLAPDFLAHADATRLGENAAAWGSYYQARPRVFSGNVRQGAAHFEQQLFQAGAAPQRQLWLNAYLSGLCHQ